MPSHLSISMDASTIDASYISHPTSPMSPPYKKQKMNLTQTYRLAHTARGKLSKEAAREEYSLRVLVGHANLLDNLMIDLSNAEKEQEDAYYNNTRSTTITFADTVVELPEESDSEDEEEEEEEEEDEQDVDEDSKSDYSDYENEEQFMAIPAKRTSSRPNMVVMAEHLSTDAADDYYDEDYENPDLGLTRTHSHMELPSHEHAVPELCHDSDDSDDESLSPPVSPTAAPSYGTITIKDFAMKTQTPPTSASEPIHQDSYWFPEQQTTLVATAC